MIRRRGRTIGTILICAMVIAAVAFIAFGRSGSPTMPTPHVIGSAEQTR